MCISRPAVMQRNSRVAAKLAFCGMHVPRVCAIVAGKVKASHPPRRIAMGAQPAEPPELPQEYFSLTTGYKVSRSWEDLMLQRLSKEFKDAAGDYVLNFSSNSKNFLNAALFDLSDLGETKQFEMDFVGVGMLATVLNAVTDPSSPELYEHRKTSSEFEIQSGGKRPVCLNRNALVLVEVTATARQIETKVAQVDRHLKILRNHRSIMREDVRDLPIVAVIVVDGDAKSFNEAVTLQYKRSRDEPLFLQRIAGVTGEYLKEVMQKREENAKEEGKEGREEGKGRQGGRQEGRQGGRQGRNAAEVATRGCTERILKRDH